MLDANMASYSIRGTPPEVRRHMLAVDPAELCVSSIVAGELLFGARSKGSPRLTRRVEQFLALMRVLSWDAADTYAALRHSCRMNGTPLQALDMLIAAHALSLDLPLATNNVREFTSRTG